jgi:Galactosyltransferase
MPPTGRRPRPRDSPSTSGRRDGREWVSERGLTLRGKLYLLILFAVLANILETIQMYNINWPRIWKRLNFFPQRRGDLFPPRGVDPLSVHVVHLDGQGGTNEEEDEMPFIPSKYNYSIEPIPTKFTLPPPQLHLETNSTRLVVLVMSARHHFDQRRAIRESWARGKSNILFVIGGPLPPGDLPPGWEDIEREITQPGLLQEQQDHHDLLDTIHPDTYKGLPFKIHYAFRWLHQHHYTQQFDWVLKVDDDVVVRLKRLQRLVLQKFNPQHPMVIGDIVTFAEKQAKGKWAEDPHYKPRWYPPWPRGASGYVVSQPIAEYLGKTPNLYYYQGEDVSLGIWLEEGYAQLGGSTAGGALTWIHSPDFVFEDGCEIPHVITGHDMEPDVLRNCFFRFGNKIPRHKARIYYQDRPMDLHVKVPPDDWYPHDMMRDFTY